MDYKRILTIQDISCVGQCSLTVALPVLSACGLETCILPSAVLSSHTGAMFRGTNPAFRDLTEDMPKILAHWKGLGLNFDAIYTGYLGSAKQIEYVKDAFENCLAPGGLKIVDPVMADSGKLYSGFGDSFVDAMLGLCRSADIIMPNITEACLMTGNEYRENPDESFIEKLAENLYEIIAGASKNKYVIITGVSLVRGKTGVAIYDGAKLEYYFHDKVDRSCHGTGDIFASVLTGAMLRGKTIAEAAKIAADFTVAAIMNTEPDPNHPYGVRFEPLLGALAAKFR